MEGLRLRQEMAKKGKTIQDVANAIGKSRDTAALKIDGVRDFKLGEIVTLAGVLGLSTEDTLGIILEDSREYTKKGG